MSHGRHVVFAAQGSPQGVEGRIALNHVAREEAMDSFEDGMLLGIEPIK